MVLMHLLALGAFWPKTLIQKDVPTAGLNAPFGARCFLAPTSASANSFSARLNAPFGARCFLAGLLRCLRRLRCLVLMHLLALGAFWLALLNETQHWLPQS